MSDKTYVRAGDIEPGDRLPAKGVVLRTHRGRPGYISIEVEDARGNIRLAPWPIDAWIEIATEEATSSS